jgi:Flp pilus assembly protein TadD
MRLGSAVATALARTIEDPAVSTPLAQAGVLPDLFAKASACHRAGQLAAAIAIYKQIVALKPDLPGAQNNLGVALASCDHHDEAAAAFRRAIALDANNWDVHINLGQALWQLGRFKASEEIFRRAIAIRPDNAEAYSGLGVALMELDRPAEAEAAFCQAISLNRSFAGAYNNLGLVLKETGRFADASLAFQIAIRLAPKSTSYYGNLGAVRAFASADPYVIAMESLAKDAASLPLPERTHLHFALAKAYEDTGRFECAFRELLTGNKLKRQQTAYDEAATLKRMQRITELFTPDFLRVHQGSGEQSNVPVFVIGMPRSGTTLIEQILASHTRIFGAGELSLLEQTTRAVGNTLLGLPYPDMVPAMSREQFRILGASYLDKLRQRAPDASRIVDKMPANFAFAGLIHLALPNAAIIHAVRDPVDTCASCFSILFTRGQSHTYDLAELGRYYRQYRNMMSHWHRVLPPGRIIDVHYEELVDDLEGTARRIIAHCGLEWDQRCLDFHGTTRTVRSASAAQVRRPIYQTSIGRKRRYEAFLGPLLAELDL